MPTREHEFWLELIDEQPSLTAALLRWLGVDHRIPPFTQVRVESAELPEYNPTEYRADKVVSFYAAPVDTQPKLSVIVEVQREYDEGKDWSWPAYVANLRARRKCVVLLVVICPNDNEATRCRKPIKLGNPGSTLRPLVIGPREVPVITDPSTVADPLDAVISAAIHGAGPEGEKVFATLLEAIQHVEGDQRQTYIDNVLAMQPEDARRLLELLMTAGTRQYKSDLLRRAYSEGEANTIILVLEARGLSVSDEARARISSCIDLDQLEAWARRAATVDAVEDLFV